jgi:signal transduction histidine kinase
MSVDVEYAPGLLRLTVYNDRPKGDPPPAGARPLEPGHGLLGMRERVAMLGGTLITAPTPEGGFLVKATLPLDTIPADPTRP